MNDRKLRRLARARAALAVCLEDLPRFLTEYVAAPNRCILATRMAHQVFARHNVRSIPWPVFASAENAAWRTAIREKADLAAAKEAGAWAVMTQIDEDGDGYPGHLVLHVPDLSVVLDADSQQFSRPDHGIVAPRSLVISPVVPGFASGTLRATRELPDGALLTYARLAAPRTDYRTTPDWTRVRPIETVVVDELVTRAAVLLDTPGAPHVCLSTPA